MRNLHKFYVQGVMTYYGQWLRQTEKHKHKHTGSQPCRHAAKLICRQADRQEGSQPVSKLGSQDDRQTGRQQDRKTDRQAGRQAGRQQGRIQMAAFDDLSRSGVGRWGFYEQRASSSEDIYGYH